VTTLLKRLPGLLLLLQPLLLLVVVQGSQGCMPCRCDATCHPRGVVWAFIT
jgi:hypothetical protein